MSVKTGNRVDWRKHKGVMSGQPIRKDVGTQAGRGKLGYRQNSVHLTSEVGTQRDRGRGPMTGRVERGTQSPAFRPSNGTPQIMRPNGTQAYRGRMPTGVWRDLVLWPLLDDAFEFWNR